MNSRLTMGERKTITLRSKPVEAKVFFVGFLFSMEKGKT